MDSISPPLACLSLFHGEALFRAGQKADFFYLVKAGGVLILNQAGTRIEAQFQTNDLFGIPEVLAGGSWSLTAIANGQTMVQPFAARRLFQTLDDMPSAHSDFIRQIAALA